MRKFCFWNVVLLLPIAFVSNATYVRIYGREIDSMEIEINSGKYQVTLRERNTDELGVYILDTVCRFHGFDYVYWAELRQGNNLVKVSERCGWDSTRYKSARIIGADSSRATVSLDPDSKYGASEEFYWLER